jgi:hypothetical protein
MTQTKRDKMKLASEHIRIVTAMNRPGVTDAQRVELQARLERLKAESR